MLVWHDSGFVYNLGCKGIFSEVGFIPISKDELQVNRLLTRTKSWNLRFSFSFLSSLLEFSSSNMLNLKVVPSIKRLRRASLELLFSRLAWFSIVFVVRSYELSKGFIGSEACIENVKTPKF